MTKRELITMLEEYEAPDNTEVILRHDTWDGEETRYYSYEIAGISWLRNLPIIIEEGEVKE